MIREAKKNDINQILELYLSLHEKYIPQNDEHLQKTWEQIVNDENHHLLVNEIDGEKNF